MIRSKRSIVQRGFVSIELMFGLIVIAIAMTVGVSLLADRMDSQNYQIAAQQQQQIADAAAKYLKDNFATVYASAGATAPAKITPLMLRNTNYLPAGFSDTNSFGQTFVVLARRVATNQLESIVIMTGGQSIDEIGTREIAENLGASGGFIPYDNTGVVQGIRGGWQLALSNYGINPGIGHTASALFLQDGTLDNDYLYRNAIPGKPELNRMNTAIDMGNNNVNNAASITASGNIIAGGNIGAGGSVTASANVTANGTVTAGNDVNANGNVNATSVNARANVTGVTASMSGETYTGGFFRTQGDGGWYSEKWGGGWYMSDSSWIRAYGNKNVYTSGQMRANSLTSEGRTEVGEYLQLDGVAVAGDSCSPNGLTGRNTRGQLLSCVDGFWRANSGVDGTYQYLGSYTGSATFSTGDKAAIIHVTGGSTTACGIGSINNRYNLNGLISGSTIAWVNDNNPDYSKSGFISFAVPANTSYQVTSSPYQCEGLGNFAVWAFQL